MKFFPRRLTRPNTRTGVRTGMRLAARRLHNRRSLWFACNTIYLQGDGCSLHSHAGPRCVVSYLPTCQEYGKKTTKGAFFLFKFPRAAQPVVVVKLRRLPFPYYWYSHSQRHEPVMSSDWHHRQNVQTEFSGLPTADSVLTHHQAPLSAWPPRLCWHLELSNIELCSLITYSRVIIYYTDKSS